eukprot:1151460-Pelagomonas_calceolata.AAC.2
MFQGCIVDKLLLHTAHTALAWGLRVEGVCNGSKGAASAGATIGILQQRHAQYATSQLLDMTFAIFMA